MDSTRVLPRGESDVGVLQVDLPIVVQQVYRVQGDDPHAAHQQVRFRLLRSRGANARGGALMVTSETSRRAARHRICPMQAHKGGARRRPGRERAAGNKIARRKRMVAPIHCARSCTFRVDAFTSLYKRSRWVVLEHKYNRGRDED